MIRSKLGFKALGLCALVLGLMALSASAAQAANWRVAGATVTTLKPSVTIKNLDGGDGTLLTKIAGVTVEFLCTAAALSGAFLEEKGKITSGGKVRFTGCTTKLNGSTAAACEPKNLGTEAGVISTNEGKGLLVLHTGGIGVTLIEAVTGETLATIEMSKECAIGSKVPVIGKLSLKDSALETESVDHLISQGPLTELWTISKTAEHVANIDGNANAALSGAHLGKLWSGLPE